MVPGSGRDVRRTLLRALRDPARGDEGDAREHEAPHSSRSYAWSTPSYRSTYSRAGPLQAKSLAIAETYGPKNHMHPLYQEHFAIGDVPKGEYILGVEIDGRRVYRKIKVTPGNLTWVVFKP